MSQNPFFRSSDTQTFMSHSFIPSLIYGLKVDETTYWKEIATSFLAILLLLKHSPV